MTYDSGNTRDLVLKVLKDVQALLGRVEERLGGVERRLGRVEDRLGGVEGRLGRVENGLGQIPQMAKTLTEMQSGLASIDTQQHLMKTDVAEVRKSINELQAFARDTQKSNAGRLNIIDGRLARIEGHFGIADA